MKTALVIILLWVASPVFAQQHQDLVASTKSTLQAQGKDLSGECGALSIVNAVAWQLRGEGAGLLDKPSGSQCRGFATDIIVYSDGRVFDVLGDAGGSNTPQWNNLIGANPNDAARWRPPSDPGLGGGSTAGGGSAQPPVIVQAPTVDFAPILQAIAQFQAEYRAGFTDFENRDNEKRSMLTALDVKLTAHDNEPSWAKKVFSNRYVQIALGGLATWITTQQVTK